MIKKPTLPAVLLGLAALAVTGWLFGSRGIVVQVEGKTWRLEIEIEKRLAEADSGWCDDLPTNASNIQRRWITSPSESTNSDNKSTPAEHCRTAAQESLCRRRQNGYFVALAHVAFPGIGRLRSEGKGYAWVPVNYSSKP